MNKLIRIALLGTAVLSFTGLARAQAGCVNSPENPTAILALIGASGTAVPWVFSRLSKKRRK